MCSKQQLSGKINKKVQNDVVNNVTIRHGVSQMIFEHVEQLQFLSSLRKNYSKN